METDWVSRPSGIVLPSSQIIATDWSETYYPGDDQSG